MTQIPKNLKDGYRQALRPSGTQGQWRIAVDFDGESIPLVLTEANTTTTIFNVSAVTANTEYSQALPADTKGFLIKARGKSRVQLAYQNGQSGTTYLTIAPGASYEDKNFYSSQVLYFQASNNAETIEIIAYT